jgi:hypothetical protein
MDWFGRSFRVDRSVSADQSTDMDNRAEWEGECDAVAKTFLGLGARRTRRWGLDWECSGYRLREIKCRPSDG